MGQLALARPAGVSQRCESMVKVGLDLPRGDGPTPPCAMGMADGRVKSTSSAELTDGSHRTSDLGWESDVALEMWIDTDRVPVSVRLAGTIGRATGARLVAVIAELIADGYDDFEVRTAALRVTEPGGDEALINVQRLITESGARVAWNWPSRRDSELMGST
jgi:hypothetical protein